MTVPSVKEFRADMDRLGQELAQEFMETLVDNVETNRYKFQLSEETIRRKGHDIPLIDSREMLEATYREDHVVSVEDTPREDSQLTNLGLAMAHEYGTKDKHIPSRPVWRNTFRDYKPTATKRVEEFFREKGKFRTDGSTTGKGTQKAK